MYYIAFIYTHWRGSFFVYKFIKNSKMKASWILCVLLQQKGRSGETQSQSIGPISAVPIKESEIG